MPHSIESLFLDWVFVSYETIGWGGVCVLMVLESTGIPFPSELIMPVAGWVLVAAQDKGHIWVWWAGLVGAVGNLGGSLLTYWVCRRWGRHMLVRYGKYVLITEQDIVRCELWFAKYGEPAVCFGRVIPLFRTFISIPAGIVGMNLGKFALYTFFGGLPWCLGLAYAGFILGENWELLRGTMRPLEFPIAIGFSLLVAWFLIRRINQVRSQK